MGIVKDPWVAQPAVKTVTKTASTVLLIRSNIVKDVETISVWPEGAVAPSSLVELARQATKEGKSFQKNRFSKTTKTSTTLIAVPLSNKASGTQQARVVGAIAMAMPTKALADAPAPEARIDPIAEGARRKQMEAAIEDARLARQEQAEQQARAAMVLHLLSLIHGHTRFEASASDFVTELADKLKARRVSVGFIRDGHTKLTAISHVATIQNSAVLARDLALTMDEALDQASTIVYPQPRGAEPRVTLAHERFVTRHDASHLVTVPIMVAEDADRSLVGALTVEFASPAEVTPQRIDMLEQLAAVLGPALDTKRRAATLLKGLFHSGLRSRGKHLLGTQRRKHLAIAAIGLILLASLFIPIEHRITATARLEGSTQRVMAAATDGYIGAVHARPGVRVKKGQALIDLDDRDLKLERRKLEAEFAQTERKYGEALVKEDQGQIAIQQARMSQLRAQVATLDDQLGRIKLSAPFDGVVLSGDQTQSLGAPVKRGDVLMTLAPANQYRLVVEVDERDIALIKLTQNGHLVLSALPDRQFAISVQRVTPVAVVKEGANVFEVEARIDSADLQIQPGLEGVAKIDTGQRPLISVLTNRLRQWLHLSLWKWKL